MTHSKDQAKIDKAFEQAINSNSIENNADTINFDNGVEALLPNLVNESIKDSEENYEGVVFNQYKIVKQIGSGGMGDVYLAKRNDGQFDKDVAIKILSKGYNNKSYKNRFVREKQILAKLRHPNIIPLLDAGETHDGIPWFVLEYINGRPINTFFQLNNLSIKETIKVFLKICDAIHFAHSKNVVHRDIKPDNILVEKNEEGYNPMILDFGIAHISDYQELTLQGNVIGTPGYMSPEQLSKKDADVDFRTDIFSLGVVFYQIFTKTKPFKASSAVESNQKTLYQQPKKIKRFIPSFPQDVQTIISKCLKKQAKNRYDSVLELKHDLENWLNGYPIDAKKDNLLEVSLRAIKRNKIISFIGVVFLVFGVFSFVKYTVDINHQRQVAMAAKQESDDLLNFVIKDLNHELTKMGRVDLLESIANKSLKHLKKHENNFDTTNDINHAISYQNIASVLTIQQNNSDAEEAYKNSNRIFEKLLEKKPNETLKVLPLLSLSYLELAAIQTKNGQLEIGNANFTKSLNYALELKQLKSQQADATLWKVYNAYIWNLMESSKHDEALVLLDKQLKLVNQGLIQDKNSNLWLNNQQKTFTAFAWYYVDLRELNKAIDYYREAQIVAEKLLETSPNSIPLMSDLQKIRNQFGYTLLLAKKWNSAVTIANKSIQLGKILFIKSPNNMIFYRELSYAYTVAGDSYININNFTLAEQSYLKSLRISEQIVEKSPNSASLVNDLAIDTFNFSKLLGKINKKQESRNYMIKAEKIIQEIAQRKNASIYYLDTYVSILLNLGKVEKAKVFLTQLKNTKGWPHENFLILVKQYRLDINDY